MEPAASQLFSQKPVTELNPEQDELRSQL
jgi:hypothetical protein